jgi:hypothetical protein
MKLSKTKLYITPDNLKKRNALFLGAKDGCDYYYSISIISTFMRNHSSAPFIIKVNGSNIKNTFYYSFNDGFKIEVIDFLINKMRKLQMLK